MDLVMFLSLLCTLFFACFYILLPRRPAHLPPGPPLLPVIGNIHQLGGTIHQSLAQLSKKYGPLMHLKLGHVDVIVVSSPELARQVLQKHDQDLSGRPQLTTSSAYNRNEVAMVWLPAEARWRALRKLCNNHMFSVQKLDGSQGIRLEKANRLREYVQECCGDGRVVDIADAAFTTSLNLMATSLFSMDLATFSSDASREFKELVLGLLLDGAAPNISDYFPFLKALDLQGLKRRMTAHLESIFKIFNDIIDQRMETVDSVTKNDLLQMILDANQRSRDDMLNLLVDLFVGGTESSALTVEWAMAELIHNPIKMVKARNELGTIHGDKRPITESDIPNLPYLQAVLNETLRLHPVAPVLLPHLAVADVKINGYIIPKNAQVYVNIWSWRRDSSIWRNPESFEPERFLERRGDIRGLDFEFIPFGSGRRACPGMPLALRMVNLIVATLIQDFDWELEGGNQAEDMNMDETFGLLAAKAVPLKAIPTKIKL